MENNLVSLLIRVAPRELDTVQREFYRETLSPLVLQQVNLLYFHNNEAPGLLFLNGPQRSCVTINSILFGHKAVIPQFSNSQDQESHIQLPQRGWTNDKRESSVAQLQYPETRSTFRFPEDCHSRNGQDKVILSKKRWAEIARDMVGKLQAEAIGEAASMVVYTLPPELYTETARVLTPDQPQPSSSSSPVSILSITAGNARAVFPLRLLQQAGQEPPEAALRRNLEPVSPEGQALSPV